MSRTHETDNARERRALCAAVFVCYSSALASLAAMAYSLTALALSAAGQQAATLSTTLGVIAR
jgi:hypothetical protein